MSGILENPIWYGLISGNKHLAIGSGTVKWFPENVTTFAAMEQFTNANFQLLFDQFPAGTTRATFVPPGVTVSRPWRFIAEMEIYQMLHDGPLPINWQSGKISSLGDEQIPDMLELTGLTNPGPFKERTIDFGNFYGMYDGARLVAMAGQRLQVFQYAEISAVCTHPDYLGLGYARQLLLYQVSKIREEDRIPILHVKSDNSRAIKLYESVGFAVSRTLNVLIFRKD